MKLVTEIGFKCKFATYAQSLHGKSDILIVKESVLGPDNKRYPNTPIILDRKRDYKAFHVAISNQV